MENKNLSCIVHDGLKYHGSATIKIMNGKKIINSCNVKNHGTDQLFKFLRACIAGYYTEAESYRPIYIQLGKNSNNPITKDNYTSYDAICNPIIANSVIVNTGEGASAGSTIHFRIPNVYINDPSGENKFNELCLYCYENLADANKPADRLPSAWIQSTEIQVDPSKKYSIIIEWKLSFSN